MPDHLQPASVLRPRRVAALADGWFVSGAVSCWVGASWGRPLPVLLGVALVVVGAVLRVPLIAVGALAIVASGLMAGTVERLSSVSETELRGVATVVSDAEWRNGALRLDIELDGTRWEAWARGAPAYRIDSATVGQRWMITADARVAEPASRRWLWPRHLAGRADLVTADQVGEGAPHYRFANALRELIDRSSTSMSQRDRVLLAGFVHGDDRGQLPEVIDDFRATGLTHLLAVSGSNVAMVLVMFGPLSRRLTRWWRLVAVSAVLGEFVVLTRGEPSVLRACVLAVLATGSTAAGRFASPLRLLALATGALVLFDPMLVRSVGFQLSVAASLGIVVGARPVAQHLVGPRWLRETMGVTVAAQLGVLPVQLATFGSLPLASFPANLAAAPVAGPAMVWGLNAGLVGGFVGEPVAAALHLPTRFLVGWVATVARWGARAGLPEVDRNEAAAVLALLLATSVLLVSWPRARLGLLLGAIVAIHVTASSGAGALPVGDDLSVLSSRPVVVVIDRPPAAWALGQLRTAGIDHVDVLVSRSRSAQAADTVLALTSRLDVDTVWAPARLRGVPVVVIEEPTHLGGVIIRRVGQRLVVDVPG